MPSKPSGQRVVCVIWVVHYALCFITLRPPFFCVLLSQMLLNFNKKCHYVCYKFLLPTAVTYLNYWGMLPDQTKSGTSTSYKNVLWTNGISWISTSLTKSLESGDRDFELLWLQEENSLNIKHEHFSSLTFFQVLILNGRLFDTCRLIKMHVMCFSA